MHPVKNTKTPQNPTKNMKFIKKNYIVQIMDINLPYGSGLSICNPTLSL